LNWTLKATALVLLLSASNGHAKLPDNIYLDDAFAWFAVETHYNYVGGKRSDGGWSLTCELRVHGPLPGRSALKLVVKSDGDAVATIRNEMLVYNPDPARADQGAPVAHAYRCGKEDKQVVQGIGKFEIDVFVIDGSSLEENFAKTYTIDVQRVQRSGGGTLAGNIPEKDAPEYYVSRHSEILSSVIHLIRPGFTSFESKNPETVQNTNGIEIVYNVSGAADNQPGSAAFFRCSVNGDPITLGKDGHKRSDQATSRSMRETVAIHTDRNALEYRNLAYQEEISFRQRVISVPLTFGDEKRRASGFTVLEEHPGEWACSLVHNGKTIRTFEWEVATDGPIVPHPEHGAGLRMGPNTYFIATRIPEGGSYTDARIVAAAAEDTGFFGYEWESRASKRMAGNLEDVGNPYPVASAPAVEGATLEAGAAQVTTMSASDTAAPTVSGIASGQANAAAQVAAEDSAATAQAARSRVADQEAELARLRAAGEADAAAEVEAELAEARAALDAAHRRAEDAHSEVRGRGALHFVVTLLLSAALVSAGLCLAGDTLKARVSALGAAVQALTPRAAILGLATMALALADFALDLVALRPLVGDGVPQLLALAGGFVLWRSAPASETETPVAAVEAAANEALERHGDKIEKLQANSVGLGLACVAGGLLHLVFSGIPLI